MFFLCYNIGDFRFGRDFVKDLTRGNIYKTFILFALPLMLSGLLSQSYNIIDTAIAGKYLGETGIASISSTSSFITLISSVLWGFCTGVSIYTAILFGAEDFRRIKSTILSSATLLFVGCFLLCVVFVIIKTPIFNFLKIDPLIREDASSYFTLYTLGLVFVILNNYGVCVLNALGISTFPLYMSIVSAAINVAGNVVAIVIFRLGVAGVAIASVFSAVVVDILYAVKIALCFKEMGVLGVKTPFAPEIFKNTLAYALPSTGQQLIMYVAGFLIAPSVNVLGASATASFSVSTHIYNVCASLYQNSSKTVSAYSSQCIGAKKFDRLKKGVFAGAIQSVAVIAPVIIVFALTARPLCLLFFEKGYTGEALDYSLEFTRLFLPFVFLNAVNNLFHSYWRGITAMSYLLLGTAVGTGARIVLTLILTPLLGMTGVHLAWALSWAVEVVPNVILFLSNRWQRVLEKHKS